MLYAFGIGEVPISVSGPPAGPVLVQTIRAVGAVTRALCAAAPGDMVGVRGPFGTDWGSSGRAGTSGRRPAGRADRGGRHRPGAAAAGPADGAGGQRDIMAGYVAGRRRSPAEIVVHRRTRVLAQAGADVRVTVDRADADGAATSAW